MRIVVQRVSAARVESGGRCLGQIGKGLLVLLGVAEHDAHDDANWLASKLCALRVFADSDGKMNLDVVQAGGSVLIVSQFTLHALVKKGNRPSFVRAARPEVAVPLYDYFIKQVESHLGKTCARGEFGADMQIHLVNDGPVTLCIDSKNKE